MGKPNNDGAVVNENEEQNSGGCDASRVCNRSAVKMIVAVIVSVNILLVGVFSFPTLFKRNGGHSADGNIEAEVQASFMLERRLSIIVPNILELESNLWDEIAVPNAKVKIMSLRPLAESNWTKVVFGVFSTVQNPSIPSVSLSLLKETFVSLVLEQHNLTLAPTEFGRVYFFEVLKFPGGITVIPEQPHFPLIHWQVLFNFTLPNSISQVVQNLAQLKQQLASGLHVRPNENLFVQLTNLEGSTVEPSTVIETSIMPVVGNRLATPRLKQLAQEITGNHAGNLGLNHTLFGNVKQIMLSSYLKDPTSPISPVPSPAPSPARPLCSSPIPAPLSSPSLAPPVPDTKCHHATAPSHHHRRSSNHSRPFVRCHHHHQHHARHVPAYGGFGSPSPAPFHDKSLRKKPYIHQNVGVAPAPLLLPPQSVPPSGVRPCHSHMPSYPLVSPSPSLSGSESMPPSPTLHSQSPGHVNNYRSPSHIFRSPPLSGVRISSPKSSPPVVLANASPPSSGQVHAEIPKESPPVSNLSPSSSFTFGPIQLITWSVLLVGAFLASFLP